MKSTSPHPFIKWVGGKRQLLSQLDPFFPHQIEHYLEPFVGGGAVFFHLLPKESTLMDINTELINTYCVIRNDPEALIQSLKLHENNAEYFYRIRSMDRDPSFLTSNPVFRASRMIYLNRCCYNGLYRVNSKGYFNAPFGKYTNPCICDESNLRNVHIALRNTHLYNADFEQCLLFARPESFVYLDPPYQSISKTGSFVAYTKEKFGSIDQNRVKKVMDQLTEIGCKVMLSNSYHDSILDLYQEYRIETLWANRAINSIGSDRGKIKEVLILNY